MYIESDAWVTNLKQKLACGSVLMSNQMEFYEFFTRALVPGVHYVEVDSRNLCHDAARQVSCSPARCGPPCSCMPQHPRNWRVAVVAESWPTCCQPEGSASSWGPCKMHAGGQGI